MLKSIVFLMPEFPPAEGGIGNSIYEIVKNIQTQEIHVIAPTTPGWETFDARQSFLIHRVRIPGEVDFSRLKGKLQALVPFYSYIVELFKIRNMSVIVCGSAHPILMAITRLISRFYGAKCCIFTYGLDILFPQRRFYRRIFNRLLIGFDVVIAISQATYELDRQIGVKPERLHIIQPTVDLSKFQNKLSEQVVIQKYGLQGKKIILSVGRLVERKGFDIMIQSLPSILKLIPNAHYIIVGKGPAKESLESLTARVGVEEHVTFAGYVPDAELEAYYRACDVFAMISRDIAEKGDVEGFGIVYLEANLAGKPVVAGRSFGVTDAVIHEKTGLMVEPTSITETSGAVVKLLSEPELAHQMGEDGRQRVLRDFSSEAAARKLLAVLSDSVV